MQLNPKMLEELLKMDDRQLEVFLKKLAKEAGLDVSALGFNAESLGNLRRAMQATKPEDVAELEKIYRQRGNQ